MATITYKCNICDRSIDLLENKKGLTTFAKCVITYGCKGKLLVTKRNPDNIRETFPEEVPGLEDYSQRNVLFNYTQNLPSNIWDIIHDLNTSPALSVYVLNTTTNKLAELDPKQYKVITINSNELKIVFNNTYTGKVQLVSRNSIKSNPIGIQTAKPLTQVTANGYFVFAIPKFLTRFEYPPTLLPTPELPYDQNNIPLRIEVSIKKPNEEEEICTEFLAHTLSNTPWNGWSEVLIRKRRNYYLFSKNILDFRTFGGETLSFNDIPDGTQLKITRVDYGTGVLQPLETESLFVLLSNSPFSTNDKIKDMLVDVGDMVDNNIDYFTYRTSDFYVDQVNVDKTYPDIAQVKPVVFIPPSPSPTISITPSNTPSASIGISPSPTPSKTPTPSVTRSPLITPTPSASVTPSPMILVLSGHIADGALNDTIAGSYNITNSYINPVTFTVSSGSLPSGITLNSNGSFSGTFNNAGAYNWTIKAVDANGATGYLSDSNQVASLNGYFTATAVLGSQAQSSTTLIPRGSWSYLIADFDFTNNAVSLYVNNILTGSINSQGVQSVDIDMVIGGINYPVNFSAWRGLIYGAQVINNGTTQAERDLLWNNGNGITFNTLSTNTDATSIGLWNKTAYAWQLNDNSVNTTYIDSKGNLNLTKSGNVGSVNDSKFGNVASFDRTGKLYANGYINQNLESRSHVSYAVWVYTEVINGDDFPSVMSKYPGSGNFQGIRCFWYSDASSPTPTPSPSPTPTPTPV